MPKIVDKYVEGMKVVRGRDWKWYDQDKRSEYGIVSRHGDVNNWINVMWYSADGKKLPGSYGYRIGDQGCYDLYEYEEKYKSSTNFKTGDEVYMFKRGNNDDWTYVGNVSDSELYSMNKRLVVKESEDVDDVDVDERWLTLTDPTGKEKSNVSYPSCLFKKWTGSVDKIKIGDIIPAKVATMWAKAGDNWGGSSLERYTGDSEFGFDLVVAKHNKIGDINTLTFKQSGVHLRLEGFYEFIISKGFTIQSSIKTSQHDREKEDGPSNRFNQEGRSSARHTGTICEVRRPDPTVSTGKRSTGTVVTGRSSQVRSSTGHRSYKKVSS
jgi:hypothetical protein